MKIMTFPKVEWKDVRRDLDAGDIISTVRNSCGRNKRVFKEGEVYCTEWGGKVKILKVKYYDDWRKFPTRKNWDDTMLSSIKYGIKMCGTDNLSHIHLRKL